nr:RidA family protein [uncultured Psychrobacter sp.]
MISHNHPFKILSKAVLIGACSLGPLSVVLTAQAAPTTTMSKTAPVFLGDGGEYPFSSAVRVGDTLYMSGQIGFKDGQLVKGGIKAETKQALDNINTTLLTYGYQKSDIVKCLAMLTDMDDFADFNEVYKAELAKPYPTRSAFGVADLAAGASVEIECIAAK